MKSFARKLRKQSTETEKKLWFYLRNRALADYKFRRQYIIGSYIVDFVCLEAKLIVEVDGSQHLNSLKDKKRDGYLMSKGYRILRFWDHEILTQTKIVTDKIHSELVKTFSLSSTKNSFGMWKNNPKVKNVKKFIKNLRQRRNSNSKDNFIF